MKITKKQALDLNNGLHSVGNLTGVKFAYAVSKNIQKLTPLMEELRDAFEPTPEYIAYQDEIIKIRKDDPEFDKKIEALKNKNKEHIEIREKVEKDFQAALKEEIDIDIHHVHMDDLPATISAKQMSEIMLIVYEGKKIELPLLH